MPTCTACQPMMVGIKLFASPSTTNTTRNEDCLGLCDPQVPLWIFLRGEGVVITGTQIYYTLLAQLPHNKSQRPVRQGDILTCERCSDEHVVACNSTVCMDDFYRSAVDGKCEGCNLSACDARPGLYRSSLLLSMGDFRFRFG